MHPTCGNNPSTPWLKYCNENPEKIEMRECIRFYKDENNGMAWNAFNEREFADSNTSQLRTKRELPFPCSHPDHPDTKIQLVIYKNEFKDVVVWTDGSADPRTNPDPKSGISCWFGDNWYTSQSSPFTEIPEMADIRRLTNKYLTSTETEACAILMALIIAYKYKFKFNIEIRTDSLECVKRIKKSEAEGFSKDYIVQLISKYIWLNVNEGRGVMVTFVPRDSDYGNSQADALAFKARKGNFGRQFGTAIDTSGPLAKSFKELNENRSCPEKEDLHRY